MDSEKNAEQSRPYEIIEYQMHAPFHIHNITWESQEDELGNMRDILGHWHKDIEIVYTFIGNAVHYIDGIRYPAYPGAVFVVNSESIHKVFSDTKSYQRGQTVAVVLHIDREFLKQMIPMIDEMYFLTEGKGNPSALAGVMKNLSAFADNSPENVNLSKKGEGCHRFDYLHIMGLIYEMLFLLSRDRLVPREQAMPINSAKNLERLRGVMQYVEEHYAENITQAMVADRFYFTKEYFARFFRKNTGLTFMEYLTRYRIGKAREELTESDETILQIAMRNGFPDARGFINAFRKLYGTTPLQYRKSAI